MESQAKISFCEHSFEGEIAPFVGTVFGAEVLIINGQHIERKK